MVQAVTELVEQGDHSSWVNSAGLPFTGRLKLQVSTRPVFAANRRLYASGLRSHHPRPAALVFTGIQVEVEAAASSLFSSYSSKKRTSGCQTSTLYAL